MPTAYLGIFTTLPTAPANAGTEMTGGSYARLAVGTAGACLFGAASAGLTTNASQIQITCTNATAVGEGLWDALSSGNILWYSNLQQVATSEAQTLASGLVATTHNPISNVTVKNNTDATTYTEGTDYYVQYDAGVICRISTGAITVSQALHITYNYPVSITIATDGSFIIGSTGNWGFSLNGYQA